MAIAAKRFENLDKQNEVPVTDFLEADNTSILNSVNTGVKSIGAEVLSFLEDGQVNLDDITIPGEDKIRKTRDMVGDGLNTAKLSVEETRDLIKGIMNDNPLATSGILQMSDGCIDGTLGNLPTGKGLGLEVDCNGRKRPGDRLCASAFGSAIAKLTDGLFNFDFKDLDGLLRSIIALAAMGYNLNLCGVFNALSVGISDTGILSRAMSTLVSGVAGKNDTTAMLDLSSGAVGLHARTELPDISKVMLEGFKIPNETKEYEYSDLNDRFNGALTIQDDGWETTSDGLLTTKGIDNIDLNKVYTSKVMDGIYDSDHLDVIPDSNELSFLF